MSAFAADVAARLRKASTVTIETSADAEAPVHRTIIWIVADESGRAFVRSVRGRRGRWYRELVANPSGAVNVGGHRIQVRAVAADDAGIEACSRLLREKHASAKASLASMLRDEILDDHARAGAGLGLGPASVLQYPSGNMDNADTIQPLNGRAPYEPGDAEAFFAHVGSGGKVEADDWLPDEYRAAVLKFVEMHANSELMGVLPERDWIMRAPTLRRKLALTSKIQDEVGHAQLLYRVAEDLGKPRAAMLQDLIDGKTKFHNVFHYPTRSWADVGIIAWLVDAAAIVSQQALRDSSYAPYARTMRKICWEESVHIMHGRDVVLTLMNGTDAQRAMVQEALDRWWGPLMQMHGPPTDPAKDKDLHWKIKSKNNEQLRQEFLSIYVPRIRELGLTIPDPELRLDDETGRWHYTEPDWDELKSVVTGHGPASQSRLDFRRTNLRGHAVGPRRTAGWVVRRRIGILAEGPAHFDRVRACQPLYQ